MPAAAAACGILAVAADSAAGLAVAGLTALFTLIAFRTYKGAPAVFAGAFIFFAALTAIEAPKNVIAKGDTFKGLVTSWHAHTASQSGMVRLADGSLADVVVTDLTPTISAGDSVTFSGRILPAGRYAGIAGMETARMAELARRSAGSIVLNGHEIAVTGRSKALRYHFDRLRRELADKVYASGLSAGAARLLTSACLGTGDVDPALRDDMRATGLAHLLCISGFHVGLVAMLLGFLLWPLSQVWRRPSRFIINLAAVWLYVLLTGATPAVVRAGVMLTVYYLVRIFGRESNAVNSLAVAFVAVLALYPYSLFSAGFQLSFCAVAGIVCFANRLNPVPGRYRMSRSIASAATVAAGACLGTLPVMLWWFGSVPLLSIPINMAATLLFPLFLSIAVLSLPFGHSLSLSADRLYEVLAAWLSDLASASADARLAFHAGAVTVMALTGALIALGLLLHTRRLYPRAGAAALLTLAVIVAVTTSGAKASRGILVDGSRFSTDIIALDGSRSALHTGGKKAARNYETVFRYHGITPDTLALQSRIDTPAGAVVCLGRKHSEPAEAAIVLLLPGFRGDKTAAIAATGAKTLLLGNALDSNEAAEARAIAEKLGLELHDLALKPFCRIVQNE